MAAIQDSLIASLKVVDSPVRCYYSTAKGYYMEGHLETVEGKVKGIKTFTEGVDNTQKQWYKDCINSDKRAGVFATFTGPYADPQTGEQIITIAQEIKIDGENYGAVGLDVAFSAFESYVQNIGLLSTGYVLVADKNGKIIIGMIRTRLQAVMSADLISGVRHQTMDRQAILKIYQDINGIYRCSLMR